MINKNVFLLNATQGHIMCTMYVTHVIAHTMNLVMLLLHMYTHRMYVQV